MSNRHVAFLRAINVGGHTVRMQELRDHFADLGFADVETFIASGNVIFGAAGPGGRRLEARIETHLADRLGYEVATFVRPLEDVRRIPGRQPFRPADLEPEGHRLYVGFLRNAPDAAARDALRSLGSDIDSLDVAGRELFWLSRTSSRDSPVSGARIEKALGGPVTLRNISTVHRLISKYGE